jgi:ribosome recycling factor
MLVAAMLRRRLATSITSTRSRASLLPASAATHRSLSTLSSRTSNIDVASTFTTAKTKTIEYPIRRWKHAGKIGHHMEKLDELAHRPEREAAQEKRQKKKDRKATKKKGKKGGAGVEETDADDDDDYEDHVLASMSSDDHGNDNDDNEFAEDDDDQEPDEDQEPSLPDVNQVKQKMMKTVVKFEESLKSIRGAEPSPELFDDIQVNAYGEMTPLKAVGQVVILSATLAHITCFDPSVAKEVQKAIQLALTLNPQTEEGGIVKVPLPRISMETRQQTAKQLQKKAESCRIRIRKVRRKALDIVKKGKDGKLAGISKDDAFAVAKELDGVTDDVIKQIKDLVDTKLESIMAV